ncbi:MAG: hypothetical protein P1Q69_03875 [Candidatus Thorarchaeota archaeon]|nr:hypothetical protein [Candidatus Thorarchaeota archaeon]
MERKKTALALTAVLVISITGVVGVWSALNTTSEMRYSGTPYEFNLGIDYFANATIYVDFVDDPTLMYRMSYILVVMVLRSIINTTHLDF